MSRLGFRRDVGAACWRGGSCFWKSFQIPDKAGPLQDALVAKPRCGLRDDC
jgi:hypothetical protein